MTYRPDTSDFALHHMGIDYPMASHRETLAATSSAPLRCGDWASGCFFLHDGRTTSLIQAIQAHSSNGSEATKVINNYNRLKSHKSRTC